MTYHVKAGFQLGGGKPKKAAATNFNMAVTIMKAHGGTIGLHIKSFVL